MKYLIAIIALASVGCAQKKGVGDLQFHGGATALVQTEARGFQGIPAIENSMVLEDGNVTAFYDPAADGSMVRVDLGSDGKSFNGRQTVLPNNARFSYVLKHGSTLYNFVTIGGSVYLMKSSDGVNWQTINDNQPVLTADSDRASIYHQLWNVGVAVDDNGTWHLLVESSDATANQYAVGLAYSTGTLVNDRIEFDTNRSAAHVIPKGGNPYLAHVPGKGLFILHGQAYDPNGVFGAEWYTTASVFRYGTNDFVTAKDRWSFGVSGEHVCDPHAIELPNGKTLITVSVAQNSIYLVETNQTISQLFDQINE